MLHLNGKVIMEEFNLPMCAQVVAQVYIYVAPVELLGLKLYWIHRFSFITLRRGPLSSRVFAFMFMSCRDLFPYCFKSLSSCLTNIVQLMKFEYIWTIL